MNECKPDCLLVLDANILIRDFWWKSSAFKYLQDRIFLSHAIVIPKISVEESKAHLIRRSQDLAVRMREKPDSDRLIEQYKNLHNTSTYNNESPKVLGERYEIYIKDKIEKFGGFIADYPEINTEDILDRSINRIKPFNKGDKGFRDTVLWLSVLELVKKYERVSFVSENVSDFADESKKYIHVDLELELKKYLSDHLNFFYFRNLDEFSAYMDKDKKNGADSFAKALMAGGYKDFELISWLTNNLVEEFSKSEIESFDGVHWPGLPYEVEAPILTYVEEVVGIDIHRAKFITDTVIEFYIDVALIGIFSCVIFNHRWDNIVFSHQVERVETESYWKNIDVRSVGNFVIKLTFDINCEKVLSFYGVPLESDFSKAYEAIDIINED